MRIVHTQKYLRMSPSKIRLVTSMIKKMSIQRAIDSLPFSQKRASEPVVKVLKTALAIAKERGFSPDEVKIAEIQVGEGPRLKRGIQVSRGRWHPIVKKMSHIRVVLETTKSEARSTKTETKEGKKEPKPKIEEIKKGVK